ncbi:kelch-like protein 26 [Clavelina lepadiformis]|uniref:kelch-like protein 26 n=1 Tax=Clavelina lepadiformis TaxID=159417 RepID=UPI00404357D5
MSFSINLQAQVVINSLNQDRTDEESFCDFTIKADDQEFKVHKNVLGVLSPYFRKMFLSDMVEKRQNETNMDGISAEVMHVVIDYIYTGKFEADMDNIYDVVAATDYMQLALVQNRCSEYLIDNLTVSNVVVTWLCSVQYEMKTLQLQAEAFIIQNLSTLVTKDMFSELNQYQFNCLIQFCNNKTPPEVICECLVNWVSHDAAMREKYFSQLFCHINLRSMSASRLLDMKEFKYVRNRQECLTKILNTLKFRPANAASSSSKCAILLRNSSFTDILVFDAQTKQWSVLPTIKEKGVTVLLSQHGAYALNQDFSQIHTLDFKHSIGWSKCPCISLGPCYENFGCTIWDGCIFVCGGEKVQASMQDKTTSKVMRLYLPQPGWIDERNMRVERKYHAVANVGDKLFVMGGASSEAKLYNSVECYDGTFWKLVSPMHEARCSFAAVVVHGQIFAIGGFARDKGNLEQCLTVERYDPSTNIRCHVAPLIKQIATAYSVCVHDGKIYVVFRFRKEVEVYDTAKNNWSILVTENEVE